MATNRRNFISPIFVINYNAFIEKKGAEQSCMELR